jgi:hypothetical protein
MPVVLCDSSKLSRVCVRIALNLTLTTEFKALDATEPPLA